MVCKQLNFCTSSTTIEFVFFGICLKAMNITNGMMNANGMMNSEWYGVLVKDFVFLCVFSSLLFHLYMSFCQLLDLFQVFKCATVCNL